MKHKEKDKLHDKRLADPDKSRCDGCHQLHQSWRLRRCGFCGMNLCRICMARHWHNDEGG